MEVLAEIIKLGAEYNLLISIEKIMANQWISTKDKQLTSTTRFM